MVIPDSVTSIGDRAFYDCHRLTSISIPDSVTSIGKEVFSNCSSPTSISIPDSVTSIGEEAFSGCSRLTSISVPDSVTSIEAPAFTECENLQDFTCPSSFAKQLQTILPKTKTTIILHIPDISGMSTKFLLSVVIGFVEDKRDWSDENGKVYAKYIKTKALKLAGMAIEHPDLFYLMLREKLIFAKDLDAFTKAVQDSGNTELIAAVLDYANSNVSEKDKAKVQQKKETLDTNVTNFLFDAEQIEQISGKTFAVTGRLKTFANRNELQACLEACGATLTERLSRDVNYLITNTRIRARRRIGRPNRWEFRASPRRNSTKWLAEKCKKCPPPVTHNRGGHFYILISSSKKCEFDILIHKRWKLVEEISTFTS